DASFGLPSRASSGRFPSVLRLRLYQILSALISAGAIRPFGFFAVQPYQIRFRLRPPVGAGFGRFAFAFRPFRLYQIFVRSGR
ncbi:hypothetical protein ACFVFQ_18655, partial [Streptomyces sp. NPDC057743]|uniref:hypothetical protein n=1 Tax=Streptomyces sp. NPDC057743 TaxID=3346236 RepID=UPI0036A71735